MSKNFQERLLKEVSLLFQPLLAAAESEEACARLFGSLGWDLESIPRFPIIELQNRLNELVASYAQLGIWLEAPPTTLDQLPQALKTVQDITLAIQKLHQILDVPGSFKPIGFEKLPEELTEFLVVDYLADRYPQFYALAMLATLITPDGGPPSDLVVDSATKLVVRHPTPRPKLHVERISKLFQDPVALLKKEYLPSGLANVTDAQTAARHLFPRMETFLKLCGIQAMSGLDPTYKISLGPGGDEVAKLTMGLFVPLDPAPEFADSGFGIILAFSPADLGDLGLVILPFGRLAFNQTFEGWMVDLRLEGSVNGFSVHPQDGVNLPDAAKEAHIIFDARLAKLANDTGVAFLIGSTQGTRLEVGHLALSAQAQLVTDKQEVGALLEIGSAAFVINPGEGDGFLQKVLPKEGIRTGFDLAVGWSNHKGLYFRGSAGLEATLPVHKDLLGVLKVNSVYLAVRTKGDDIEVAAAATASVKLGPFNANIERMGLLAKFTFPSDGGNLGPANVTLDFKPPDGVGVAIDASTIVGGGYLFLDGVNQQYAGILQLEIKGGISLKAIGLLTTRLPGLPPGVKGFSLLVIISAEFSPIQLGFGFTLNGVGGLLGVNRTMVLEVLRSGIKNRTLDSVLFPKNPVANAPQIISNLQTIFPPVTGRYVFGPMARLGWGSPTIISVNLGIVLEFPSPLRLAIMGQIRMVLPSEEVEEARQIVVLRMDVLGAIDFDKGEASIDATLYDSRVTQFVISGDMAMRLNWGASPTFAVSVGGFNPRFQPPPGLPKLERAAISLATSDNPRVRLESYLAQTSNSVQFGARLDVYAAIDAGILGTFSASAYLGFDALVHFPPLSFVVDIYGGAAIRHNGNPILAADVHLTLSGPSPWHAWGEATIHFFGRHQITFDTTSGDEQPQPPLPAQDPLQKLKEALEDRRNWSAQLPSDGHMLVTLRQIPNSEISPEVLMHPFGELTFRQRVVPLDIAISKFGSTTPTHHGPFTITDVKFNDQSIQGAHQMVRDLFAPGQFFELSDDEKLSQPAFVPLPSGFTGIGTAAIKSSATRVTAEFQYDTVVIDNKEELSSRRGKGFEYSMDQDVLVTIAGLGAAGQTPMRFTGGAQFAGSTINRVKVKDPEYVVVSTEDMTVDAVKPSYTEAEAARRAKGNVSKQYQVVGRHEVP
jgi:hypothetical protein